MEAEKVKMQDRRRREDDELISVPFEIFPFDRAPNRGNLLRWPLSAGGNLLHCHKKLTWRIRRAGVAAGGV